MRTLDRKCAKANGVADYEDLIDELNADTEVRDGDKLICGDMTFTVVSLAGHTKCSVGFYLEQQRLLLGTETLGVYFGSDTYLPSYLVGYNMALESFRKANSLEIDSLLIPHYGMVDKKAAREYLENSERVSRSTALQLRQMLDTGMTKEEVLEEFTKAVYKENVAPIYPIDAFRLNTSIMIDLIAKEYK